MTGVRVAVGASLGLSSDPRTTWPPWGPALGFTLYIYVYILFLIFTMTQEGQSEETEAQGS